MTIPHPSDARVLRWATALTDMCERAGVRLRGLFLSTDDGVQPLST
jgi:hypothetical protein